MPSRQQRQRRRLRCLLLRPALEALESRLHFSRVDDLIFTPDGVPQAPDDIPLGPPDPPDDFDLHQVGSLEPAIVPVSTTDWLPVGPAPIKNGQAPGGGAVTGRLTGVAVDPTDPNTIFICR